MEKKINKSGNTIGKIAGIAMVAYCGYIVLSLVVYIIMETVRVIKNNKKYKEQMGVNLFDEKRTVKEFLACLLMKIKETCMKIEQLVESKAKSK